MFDWSMGSNEESHSARSNDATGVDVNQAHSSQGLVDVGLNQKVQLDQVMADLKAADDANRGHFDIDFFPAVASLSIFKTEQGFREGGILIHLAKDEASIGGVITDKALFFSHESWRSLNLQRQLLGGYPGTTQVCH